MCIRDRMYAITKGEYAKKFAQDTQLYQIIHVNERNLEYRAYEATGELYDAFTLQKRDGMPNLLIEALPEEKRQ